MVAASKIPMLKPGEYELWRIRMEQYIQMVNYSLWEVIENGNAPPITKVVKGVETAIEKRFGGNVAAKKSQRNLLKHQYENFTASSSEKFLRSLSPEWNINTIMWKNKPEVETLSLDNLYNNLKIYEPKAKGTSISNSNKQNIAFVSSNSTNNTNGAVNTAHEVSTASSQVNNVNSSNIHNLSDVVICAFLASQPSSPQLVNEDLEHIHIDDLEEIDLKWQMAVLTMRARRFSKKTGRKLSVDVNETIGFDKSNVECYYYHKRGYFARECRAPRHHDNKQKEVTRRNVLVETPASTTLVSCNGLGLEEFVSEPIVSEPALKKPVVEISEAKASADKPKVVRKNNDAPLIEDWVSDSENEAESKPKKNGNPQQDLQEKGVIDSGCSRHMTGNMSYLTDFEEIDGGYVAFGGNPKGGKITGKASKDGTSAILKTFITGIENLVEAVNIACYVQNRVLVVKPHNKTLYELFHGYTSALRFMRQFGCPITILNTKDHLGKFDDKANEGFFVGYSLNSKAFRVFNSRTRIAEENLHIRFSENTPNITGSGPNWLFNIDALTKSMNYKPIVAENQSTKACDDVGVNTPRSGEDSLKLTEMMEICTTLQNRVLVLETTKTTQALEIESLNRKVKKLEKKFDDDVMFDADKDLQGKKVIIEQEVVVDKEPIVDAAKVSAAITVTIDDITLAKALEALKTSKPQIREIVIKDHQEPSESRTTTTVSSQQPSHVKVQDKGKGIKVESEMPMKKKDQISLDKELAFKLQAKEEEEERLAREKAQRIKKVNIDWDDVQAKIEANFKLAQRLQEEEQE
uniref:Ribonuclease H-like domain-containing protein n=1 Tax=Tanacetum cinerariifolium TaxID=118510 RepID=A0A6L2J4N9_TANCI|nr:ribonuclease H-like domain-containing protein [Tanacetum cinerariifolium]